MIEESHFLDSLRETKEILIPEIEKTLKAHNKSQVLYEAMSYSVLGNGKALRPTLCLMSCEALGGQRENALAAAVALECIHAYSLIHDDLPAMDDDDLRRGKKTNHKVYGEAMAILAGDGLQSLAFLKISESYESALAHHLNHLLSSASLKMAAGQSLDVSQDDVSDEKALEEMHRLKTGALIRAAVLMGAACAGLGSDTDEWKKIDHYSKLIGLAFQVTDDVLDVTATDAELGKTSGKDAEQEKVTYVSLLGLEAAKKKAENLIDEALKELETFPEDIESLKGLAHFILKRRR